MRLLFPRLRAGGQRRNRTLLAVKTSNTTPAPRQPRNTGNREPDLSELYRKWTGEPLPAPRAKREPGSLDALYAKWTGKELQ